MNKLLTGTASIALCAFWASSCASTEPPPKAPAAATAEASDHQAFNPKADTAELVKNLPSDLPGEIERAHALRVRGDYEDAAKALSQIMLIASDNPKVVGEYGKVLLQEGRAKEAVGFLKRAAELAPNDWTLYSAMGVAMDQAGDHAGAKMAYQHALALKPGEPSVMNNLAISRALAGDVAAARTIIAQAQANGSPEPKIKNNAAAIDAMKSPDAPAAHPEKLAQSQPAPAAKKMAPAAQPAKLAQTKRAPAAPAVPKAAAPRPAPEKLAEAVNTKATVAAEKKLGPNVVMQPVPVDPLAGPVRTATHAPRKLAADAPAAAPVTQAEASKAPAAKATAKPQPAPPPPALRTASGAD